MPSRRGALAALGAAVTLSLSGCTDIEHVSESYCNVKGLSVGWTFENQRYTDTVAVAEGWPESEDDDGSAEIRVAEELPTLADGPRRLVATEPVHDLLRSRFETVTYHLSLVATSMPQVSRSAFNSVDIGDRVRWTEVGVDAHVHGVDPVDPTDVVSWETEFRQFDFSERHSDHGEPLGDLG